ncbi:hypothetical protein [Halorussus aquaticus]|uniref:Uncharacterized protein n=1 Tax=Halorussus aquaticus TaxID=2953748 RepID=A0ABD5Q6D3_9EURY|nr:hypothetical protein [Halorussus aquaticus]
MPSRRAVIAGTGTVAGGVVLGWVATGGLAQTGRVVRKRIGVSWEYGGGELWHGDLLQTHIGPDGEIGLAYDPSYVGPAVTGPRDVSVGDHLHEALEDEFRNVEYRLGVCGTADGEDCAYRILRAGRDGFNRAQLADSATVTDFADRLFVHEVTETSEWSGTATVAEFDFDRRHTDRGR